MLKEFAMNESAKAQIIFKNILDEADHITSQERQETYGHPLDNLGLTAALWSVAFGRKFSPEDVSMAMILVKLARELHMPKRDNLVDICGYARTMEQIRHERKFRKEEEQFTFGPLEELERPFLEK
jgi:hypothetical protein